MPPVKASGRERRGSDSIESGTTTFVRVMVTCNGDVHHGVYAPTARNHDACNSHKLQSVTADIAKPAIDAPRVNLPGDVVVHGRIIKAGPESVW
jgi:hypothetical protein